MTYRVRFTEVAEADLVRLYEFILTRDSNDWSLAEQALDAIKNAVRGLEQSPFSYRKASTGNSLLRELVIPFGATGYVALAKIETADIVTILAVRHHREDDYY